MARRQRKLKMRGGGAQPAWLAAKQPPVSAHDPPWWRSVMQELTSREGLVGTIVSIDELTASLPRYPDGRRVMRGRVVARRLAPILELVERGPNSSLGIGARYRILPLPDERPAAEILDEEWLQTAASKMAGSGKVKKK